MPINVLELKLNRNDLVEPVGRLVSVDGLSPQLFHCGQQHTGGHAVHRSLNLFLRR